MRFTRVAILLFSLLLAVGAPYPVAAETPPERVRVGFFITNLFDLDFARRDVEAQFWVWFNHADASFDPRTDVEVVNARSATVLNSYREQVAGKGYWDQLKYATVLDQNWTVANYPFDRQTIRIVLESAERDARKLQFEADTEGTKLRRDLKLAGWQIDGMKITAVNELYETAYGDPSMSSVGPSIYPRVTVEINVKRHGWRLLLSTFLGFGLAIALSGIVLASSVFRSLSEAIDMGAQLAVGTGALFCTIGAGYILQSGLPPTTEFSLADAFQLAAFSVTFLTMLKIFAVQVMRKNNMSTAALLTARVLFALYLISVTLIVVRVGMAVAS